MADTAHKTEEEKKEYFDTPDELEAKVTQLAQWIRESRHFIAFTGAGISTSAGVPDYRSGYNTVLPTGPGAWEKKAQNKEMKKKNLRVAMQSAVPTPTHMAFVKMMDEGLLKYVVSQNVDGLHRKSGIDPNKLGEVHGNTNLEKCKRCGKEYMRDFRVRNAQKVHSHETGRKCDNPECRGDLVDTIINFGENLNDQILTTSFHNGEIADVCLAMGSSLRVTPAANIPESTGTNGGKLVIVNLQKTPLDRNAAMCIHAFCDTVMNLLMEKLGLVIPPFKLVRRVEFSKTLRAPAGSTSQKECLTIKGVDVDNCPFSLFPEVLAEFPGKTLTMKKEPFVVAEDRLPPVVRITLHFHGHYGEVPLPISLNTDSLTKKTYMLVFDPSSKVWENATVIN